MLQQRRRRKAAEVIHRVLLRLRLHEIIHTVAGIITQLAKMSFDEKNQHHAEVSFIMFKTRQN